MKVTVKTKITIIKCIYKYINNPCIYCFYSKTQKRKIINVILKHYKYILISIHMYTEKKNREPRH